MRLGVLFSGGKDSTYAAWLAKRAGHNLTCLISMVSANPDSFMFHTPAIEMTKKQSKLMKIPLIIQKTKGNKEDELIELKKAIKDAIKTYNIEGIVTGAVGSVYQSSRIQSICNDLNLDCFNPLWQKNQIELLNELIQNDFIVILVGVAAFPLDKSWIGRRIDKKFVKDITLLENKYKVNPAGEGGEFETLVLNCPLFSKKLSLGKYFIIGEGNSWRINPKV